MSPESWVVQRFRSRRSVASSTTKSGTDQDHLQIAFREWSTVLGALGQKGVGWTNDRTSEIAEPFHT